ncbi:TetR/AcrR family transcriptional regulator [Rhizobium sp. TH2]|uniref:TetR/AcrR family transcriptional regulator n=1 Tax=Rhizobium sp. TH2 TaxID=2775403 RepID=UPI002157C17B|nr:TetR/AcrR family transcriptional regulator [Rhizobium sp. TH2]UVC06848.1 TetR/AcrR family transcriptional regulator [Rhizobium sp. TH2]
MPKTWGETLEGHREAVRQAVMEAALALASERGFQKVSMSDVAARAAITRATLYKYFSDVDSIFEEWHRSTVHSHLAQFAEIADGVGDPGEKLSEILEAYAMTVFRHHGTRFASMLHRQDHARKAEASLVALIEKLVLAGARSGVFRKDIPPDELARFCHSSLSSAFMLSDERAVRMAAGLVQDALSTRLRIDGN